MANSKKVSCGGYTDNGNGTVTDKATGLVWQKCSMGQTGSGCSGSATQVDWTSAGNYCSSLSLAGKTWRPPTVQELQTLVNYGSAQKIDSFYFPNTSSNAYWSSTEDASNSSNAWVIGFDAGNASAPSKSSPFHVRCVSGTMKSYLGNFTDNGDDTIKDNTTGLVWQKCSMGQNSDPNCSGTASSENWENALNFCKSLSLAGRSWRLPNVNELFTLLDIRKSTAPMINTIYFPNTLQNKYWSSTTNPQSPNTDYAFHVNFPSNGGVGTANKMIQTMSVVFLGLSSINSLRKFNTLRYSLPNR